MEFVTLMRYQLFFDNLFSFIFDVKRSPDSQEEEWCVVSYADCGSGLCVRGGWWLLGDPRRAVDIQGPKSE